MIDEGVLQFGQALLEAGDLDPVYNFLIDEDIPLNKLHRWLHAYSMFYHVGVANAAAGQDSAGDYWDFIKKHFRSLPRGEERRHFRGEAGKKAVDKMGNYYPEDIVHTWYRDNKTFQGVADAVKRWPLYGDWIAFKLADMGERILRIPIDFSDCALNMYKEPRAGAALVLTGDEHVLLRNEEIMQVVNWIITDLNAKGYMAPPWYDRPLNIQEAETILCKYKSHKHGHYPVGKDVEAVKKALTWKTSTLSS